MVADVLINITAKQLRQLFTYAVPDRLDVKVGSRVIVPFGPRRVEGIVLDIHEKRHDDASFTIKPILSILSKQAGFRQEMIETAMWISQYYLCNLSDAMRLFMIEKQGLKTEKNITVLQRDKLDDEGLRKAFSKHDTVDRKVLLRRVREAKLEELIERGVLHQDEYIRNSIADKKEKWLFPIKEGDAQSLCRSPRQQALLKELFAHGPDRVSFWQQKGYARDVLKGLCEKGFAHIEEKDKSTRDLTETLTKDVPWVLTEEQQKAVDTIKKDQSGKTYLLHGVTGSGKTEVYMHLASDVLQQGRQVLVLVPEIALTGQIVRRFIRRFGNDVVVMHSQLSKGERRNNWLRMANGESHICIGARSAVFTALRELGLVIIDEEHDGSYKQDESPRYHAVDVARKRASYYGCPVILGSATPAIGDYYKAMKGEYTLIELTQRPHKQPLPEVTVVDMRDELARGNYHVLSDAMTTLIETTLARKEQAIILLNRRGFSTFVMCRKCGYVVNCDTCDVAMVYHKNQHELRCHYCDAVKPVPTVCPACGSKYIKFFGTGTEKVEEQLREQFPSARVIRLDQDTTSRKNSSDRIIEAFRRHEYDILLGTQMVAKGHDFESVSAVGILSADSLLNLPAYWAGERTFQLLTQAAGRAGRGDIPGHVVMQTYAPDHYVIECAKKQDYKGFYEKEIAYREELQYPPFTNIIKITVSDENETKLWQLANDVAQLLQQWTKEHTGSTHIVGPFPDIFKKIRNRYRAVILIKGTDLDRIKQFMHHEPSLFRPGIVIDVDSMG